MLVQTPTLLEPGQKVDFEIVLEGPVGRVTGEAVIVRQAVPERGGVSGVGVHFVGFSGSDREVLDTVLENVLAEPLDMDFDA